MRNPFPSPMISLTTSAQINAKHALERCVRDSDDDIDLAYWIANTQGGLNAIQGQIDDLEQRYAWLRPESGAYWTDATVGERIARQTLNHLGLVVAKAQELISAPTIERGTYEYHRDTIPFLLTFLIDDCALTLHTGQMNNLRNLEAELHTLNNL